MPDELHFWDLVELGSRDPEELRRRITDMSEAELVDFYWTYHEHAANLKDEEFTRHLEPPVTEDFVDDVAQWVVAQGEDFYDDVMMTPSNMPPDLPDGAKPSPWPGFTFGVYQDRYDAPLRLRDDPPPRPSSPL